ncbi:MAG: hypothetical protein H6668_04955 [Ardenticatenaceae bacterium]|nr:hypothetical protein [Ardenticatenaceae bacterium]
MMHLFRQAGVAAEISKGLFSRALQDQLATTHPKGSKIHQFATPIFWYKLGPILDALPQPLLIIGNPPWVTNAQLGVLVGSIFRQSNFGINDITALMGSKQFLIFLNGFA